MSYNGLPPDFATGQQKAANPFQTYCFSCRWWAVYILLYGRVLSRKTELEYRRQQGLGNVFLRVFVHLSVNAGRKLISRP